jgi:hypothetical protein
LALELLEISQLIASYGNVSRGVGFQNVCDGSRTSCSVFKKKKSKADQNSSI